MGRMYAVPYQGTITAAGGNADLLELLPAAGKPIKLRGWSIGQISEVQDAGEEGLRISVIRMTATVTGGNGTSVTPVPLNGTNPAAGFTAECNGATVATTSGTSTVVGEHAWINRNTPWDWFYPDRDFCPDCKNAEGLFVRLETTLADDMTICMTFWVEED